MAMTQAEVEDQSVTSTYILGIETVTQAQAEGKIVTSVSLEL